MAAKNESTGLRELLWPFGRFHVLGVALIGSLSLAALTDAPFWQWIGLAGGVFGSLWIAVLLYRNRHRA